MTSREQLFTSYVIIWHLQKHKAFAMFKAFLIIVSGMSALD